MGKRAPDLNLYDQAAQHDRDGLGVAPERVKGSFELLDQPTLDAINGVRKSVPPTARRTAPEAKQAEPPKFVPRLHAVPKAPPPVLDDFDDIIARPTYTGSGWRAYEQPAPAVEPALPAPSREDQSARPLAPSTHTGGNALPPTELPAANNQGLSTPAVAAGAAAAVAASNDEVQAVLAETAPAAAPPAAAVADARVSPAPSPAATQAASAPTGTQSAATPPVPPASAPLPGAAAPLKAESAVTVDPPVTVDDVTNVAPCKPEPVHPGYVPQKKRRRGQLAVLLVAALIIACILGAAMIRDLSKAAELTDRPAGALVVPPVQPNVISPDTTTMVEAPAGSIGVPGTGYIDAGGQTPGQPAESIVPVWPAPFDRGGSPDCALLHGGAVLVLETDVSGAGSRAFKVQRRECIGWIDGQFLSPVGISPDALPNPAATVGPSGK